MSEDEGTLEVRRWANEMRDLVGTKMWTTFSEILESQIKQRETIILNNSAADGPSGEAPIDRLLRLEQIKGARLGLRLALETPQRIIEDAKALSPSIDDDGDE